MKGPKILTLNLLGILLAAAIGISTHTASAGGKALLIVDAQDSFFQRFDWHIRTENQQKLAAVIAQQRRAIVEAQRRQIPIFIVEFANSGKTNRQIMEQIGPYRNVVSITKTTNDLFSPASPSAAIVKHELKRRNISDVIVVGASGGACVRATIDGAIDQGLKVRVFKSGVIDFNYDPYIYPYSYRQFSTFESMQQRGFTETDDIRVLFR